MNEWDAPIAIHGLHLFFLNYLRHFLSKCTVPLCGQWSQNHRPKKLIFAIHRFLLHVPCDGRLCRLNFFSLVHRSLRNGIILAFKLRISSSDYPGLGWGRTPAECCMDKFAICKAIIDEAWMHFPCMLWSMCNSSIPQFITRKVCSLANKGPSESYDNLNFTSKIWKGKQSFRVMVSNRTIKLTVVVHL